ncbi:hypothetical protein [Acinetobacter johnsonii]|uniref:hypothetical protein n=1 Tax=Acinetobacter johnsonii TaxID=40214 RepID=UPI0011E6CFEC|nr:hypothetical protein [Acinetobacter johnsonii]QEK36147.1 hypothetical protein FYN22_09875 [Acinetobacter johnsonii]QQV08956.1 hypothetical protein I6I49_16170 [Acinetobacter johnsonii]
MNAVMADKFEQFEWLTHGITAKSPNFEPQAHGTGEKPLNYEDRLGAIATMDTQLAKSVTSVIVYGECSVSDFEYIRNHLAKIMMDAAYADKKREPEQIAIYHLSWQVAKMVIVFALNPDYENNFTSKGRLEVVAGISTIQMPANIYRQTWKPYENLMVIALEMAIKEASEAIDKYRRATYKEFEA